jgi:hypothetical protein
MSITINRLSETNRGRRAVRWRNQAFSCVPKHGLWHLSRVSIFDISSIISALLPAGVGSYDKMGLQTARLVSHFNTLCVNFGAHISLHYPIKSSVVLRAPIILAIKILCMVADFL